MKKEPTVKESVADEEMSVPTQEEVTEEQDFHVVEHPTRPQNSEKKKSISYCT